MSAGREWWAEFFDDRFAEVVLARAGDEAPAAEVDALVARLGVRAGDRVFDQCCGNGRVALALARRGLRVVGVDLSEGYVRAARARATAEGLACEFVAGDAFAFVPREPCDAAVNWFTSFGFAADDARNEAMVRRAFEALRPGGRFALDYANTPRVLREFRECMVEQRATPRGEVLLVRESRLALARGMMEQRWTYVAPSGERLVRDAETRLFMPHELGALFERCGFSGVELLGGADGGALTEASARCVVVGRREG